MYRSGNGIDIFLFALICFTHSMKCFQTHKLNNAALDISSSETAFKQYLCVVFLTMVLNLQVPKGWDKLCVSIISVETGRTTTKTGKSSVRTGNCRWTETLSDSIWIPQDDASKEVEQCLFKLVVAMV